ncbi:MAG TPA: hypothetical protein VFQ53_41395 [Kofleriaceae bacterium]|nr:hypothetical protein [Kofleriaceae bacterium]
MRRLLIPAFLAACSPAVAPSRPTDVAATPVEREPAAATVSEPATCNPVTSICWTETPRFAELAAYHKKLAADRRAISPALQAAEASACIGLSPDDRDLSPFTHTEDIVGVTLLEARSVGKLAVWYTAGATVTFYPVPGLSVERLQRVVDCQLVRNAALDYDRPELPNCPLVPKGVEATVRADEAGFAVDVRAEDAATAKLVFERAERLRPVPPWMANN